MYKKYIQEHDHHLCEVSEVRLRVLSHLWFASLPGPKAKHDILLLFFSCLGFLFTPHCSVWSKSGDEMVKRITMEQHKLCESLHIIH